MAAANSKARLTPWICLISRLSSLFVGREMSRIGFGPGQFFLLSELYTEEGLSQDELSRRVGVDKSNTSRSLAKLERYELIRRENDSQNHRVKKIYLEPKAFEIKQKFNEIQRQWNAELLNGFSEKEKKTLFSSLKKIINNAESVLYSDTP